MATSLVLDTDVTSRIWRNDLTPQLEQQLTDTLPFITFVTLAEALRGAHLANWGNQRTSGLRTFYATAFALLPWDESIPEVYARLSSGAMRGGRTVTANDCWIAATCVAHGLPLLTNNRKDFTPLEPLGLELR